MFKQKAFKNLTNGKKGTRCFQSRKFPLHFREWLCSNWAVVFVAFALLLCVSIYAEADLVYGRVYGAKGKFPPEGTFKLTNRDDGKVYSVKTDKNKGYSIVLPQGIYDVKFEDSDNIRWVATIHSVDRPTREDIYLEKAE